MDILFKTSKLAKICNSDSLATQRFGPRLSGELRTRLDEMRAATTLAHLRTLPQARCHELTGNLRGQLSVDLKHPLRLLFVPADDPIPRKKDGGLDWERVGSVVILGVEDTHG